MGPVQVSHSSQTRHHLTMFNFLLLVTLAVIATASPVEVENTETKASSPLINCGSQCSSLTFRDANGVVQGNCLTVDTTGAQWCYVDPAYSSCQDSCPPRGSPTTPGLTRPAPPLLWAPLSVPVLLPQWSQWPQWLQLSQWPLSSQLSQGPTIQEIFGANGGYDPESIGEPRH